MTDRDAEVPLDRQDAMQTATDDGSGFWLDIHLRRQLSQLRHSTLRSIADP
jgi:hypothetical protein